ncbi:MAG: hypothetical protein ACKO28_11800 [Cyanobium sp.]
MSLYPLHRNSPVSSPGSLSDEDLAALTESQRWVALIIAMGVAMVMIANVSSALVRSQGELPSRQAFVLQPQGTR